MVLAYSRRTDGDGNNDLAKFAIIGLFIDVNVNIHYGIHCTLQ